MKTTGASEEDIEAAAKELWIQLGNLADSPSTEWSQLSLTIKSHIRARVSLIIAKACGTDQRIVDVADLKTVCEFLVACNDEFNLPADVLAAGNRIAGMIGGGEWVTR